MIEISDVNDSDQDRGYRTTGGICKPKVKKGCSDEVRKIMAWGWDLSEDASQAAKALARIEPVRVVKFRIHVNL